MMCSGAVQPSAADKPNTNILIHEVYSEEDARVNSGSFASKRIKPGKHEAGIFAVIL